MNWRKHEDESNPIILHGIVTLLQHIMENAKASEQSPTMPARAKPMNPTGGANEGGGEETTQKGGGQCFRCESNFRCGSVKN
jgi:hypothetical protein